jgi:hypothetical protein
MLANGIRFVRDLFQTLLVSLYETSNGKIIGE